MKTTTIALVILVAASAPALRRSVGPARTTGIVPAGTADEKGRSMAAVDDPDRSRPGWIAEDGGLTVGTGPVREHR